MNTMHDEDERMGPLIKLLRTGSGSATVLSTGRERGAGKVSTRGISAKMNNAKKSTPTTSWEAGKQEGTSTIYKRIVPCPALARRNSPRPGTFFRTASGQQGTRTFSIACTASEQLALEPRPRSTRRRRGSTDGDTLGETLETYDLAPSLTRETSGEKAHQTPMRNRPTANVEIYTTDKSSLSEVPSHGYFTRTQSSVMYSCMENLQM